MKIKPQSTTASLSPFLCLFPFPLPSGRKPGPGTFASPIQLGIFRGHSHHDIEFDTQLICLGAWNGNKIGDQQVAQFRIAH